MKIKKKQNLILLLEVLKKKSINSGYVEIQEISNANYLSLLRQNILKVRSREYLLTKDNLF